MSSVMVAMLLLLLSLPLSGDQAGHRRSQGAIRQIHLNQRGRTPFYQPLHIKHPNRQSANDVNK
jgi:hypothetical protein